MQVGHSHIWKASDMKVKGSRSRSQQSTRSKQAGSCLRLKGIVVADDFYDSAKLSSSASIYTAELNAIINAMNMVYHTNQKSFVIYRYSDSKSALESLNNYNSSHPLVQKAQEWLFRICCRHKSVSFCLVPAHVGIIGNERADSKAKIACNQREI